MTASELPYIGEESIIAPPRSKKFRSTGMSGASSNGYGSPYYDTGYYGYGYAPSYYYDPYYYDYGPSFYGSFSYYRYNQNGGYNGNYGTYSRSYQGPVTQPNISVQSNTSSSRTTMRHHRDRSDSHLGRAGERQRSVARAEQRQQERSTRQSTRLASSGRVTNEQREHGG